VIFRLYFVDTPEEERVYADRIAVQAAYFGISPNAAVELGHEAGEFTKQALATETTNRRPTICVSFRHPPIPFGSRTTLAASGKSDCSPRRISNSTTVSCPKCRKAGNVLRHPISHCRATSPNI
jgi:hypothetical protein